VHSAQNAQPPETIIQAMETPQGRKAMDPKQADTDPLEQKDASPAAEPQRPAARQPATFRAVEKLNPDLEPFIFFGF